MPDRPNTRPEPPDAHEKLSHEELSHEERLPSCGERQPPREASADLPPVPARERDLNRGPGWRRRCIGASAAPVGGRPGHG